MLTLTISSQHSTGSPSQKAIKAFKKDRKNWKERRKNYLSPDDMILYIKKEKL